jgi:hypothetical protein
MVQINFLIRRFPNLASIAGGILRSQRDSEQPPISDHGCGTVALGALSFLFLSNHLKQRYTCTTVQVPNHFGFYQLHMHRFP